MEQDEVLNEVIDRRMLALLQKQNIICRNIGQVIRVSDDAPLAVIEFFGDDKHLEHTFPYRRNYLTLQAGDLVYIENKIGDTTSSIIVDKLYATVE